MRIGLAQLNPTVGDLTGNRLKLLSAYHHLVAAGAQLVVFPELALCGYPPRDLLFKRRFVPDVANSLAAFALEIGDVPALVGTVTPNPSPEGRRFHNSAAFCHRSSVVRIIHKCLLPTYDVFDEDRYFEPAPEPGILEYNGMKIGVTICEDIWTRSEFASQRLYRANPVRHLGAAGVDLMLNLSASPWHHGKGVMRAQLVTEAAFTLAAPVVYCNAVGGNDELIFDGRSLVVDGSGSIIARLPAFTESVQVIDTASHADCPAPPEDDLQDMHDALVLGLRDYAHKSGFKQTLVALSGGIDSAVVAALAVEALGPDNVIGVSLPSSISSHHSREDALQLAANLGIRCDTLPIADAVASVEATVAPVFTGLPRDVTEENIQARIRGVIMMALSNKYGALLLTTGNKSEIAVGYCTLYGDMCGGLAVISDVFKTKVYALARWINRDRELIPVRTIEKPPSAELRPDQTDQDTLPHYEVLDAIVKGYVEEGLSRLDLAAQGFDETLVNDIVRKIDLNEYKRKQAAPGLKITPLAFGVGRRIPLVQKYVS